MMFRFLGDFFTVAGPVFLLTPFLAGLLWVFGVHLTGQKDDKYTSYFGVACLCALSTTIYLGIFSAVMSEVHIYKSSTKFLVFLFTLIYFILQSLISVFYGKWVWQVTWFESFKTWFVLLILFFISMIVCWVQIFSY